MKNTKTVQLVSIALTRFKGVDALTIEFPADGTNRSASIYGANHAGKSTVCDAFCWLLFDRDGSGAKDFDVKPRSADGSLRYPGAETSVEAALCIDGEPVTLRRAYREVWTQQRGASERTLTGNTSDYFIDGVPKKLGEYNAFIRGIAGENVFRILTGIHVFARDLPWAERRKILFDMCGVASDAALAATDARFADLAPRLEKLSIDDIRRRLDAERKTLSAEKNRLPERIDTLTGLLADASAVDYSADERRRSEVGAGIDARRAELTDLRRDTASAACRNRIDALANDIAALDVENRRFRAAQAPDNTEYFKRRDKAQAASVASRDAFDDAQRTVRNLSWKINDIRAQLDACRAEYNAAGSADDEVCPTCLRPYDADKLAGLRAKKSERMRGLRDKGIKLADELRAAEAEAASAAEREKCAREALDAAKKTLDACRPPEPEPVSDMPGYADRLAELNRAKAGEEAHLAELEGHSAGLAAALEADIQSLLAEAAELDRRLSRRYIIDETGEKLSAARAEQKSLALRIGEVDRNIALCDDFVRLKVKSVEESVNSRFRLVSFRLFEEQINGGLRDCCDVTKDGVPYSGLSSSEKINAALDIVRALSDFYGLRLPLFVDNAECVTELLPADTQIIRLVVSEQDAALRTEKYNY